MTTIARLTLHQFVASKMNDGVTDYHEEARRLVALMEPADRDEYLVQALVATIRTATGARRRDAFDGVGAPETREEETTVRAEPITKPSPSPAPTPQNLTRRNRHRDQWSRLMAQTGIAAGGGKKRIGEMNRDDLLANIELREKQAASSQFWAERFRTLLKELDNEGVDTVGRIAKIPSTI